MKYIKWSKIYLQARPRVIVYKRTWCSKISKIINK